MESKMSNEKLQAELKTLQDYVEVTRNFVMEAEKDSDKHKERILEIEAQIAEEKKPKMRNGDVYDDDEGCLVIVGKRNGKFVPIREDERTTKFRQDDGYYNNCRPAFNAYDEMKALQENVTEFEMKDKHGDKLLAKRMRGQLHLTIDVTSGFNKNVLCFTEKQEAELILKLRQMEATMKREEAKK
jgi:hypothetical protein